MLKNLAKSMKLVPTVIFKCIRTIRTYRTYKLQFTLLSLQIPDEPFF